MFRWRPWFFCRAALVLVCAAVATIPARAEEPPAPVEDGDVTPAPAAADMNRLAEERGPDGPYVLDIEFHYAPRGEALLRVSGHGAPLGSRVEAVVEDPTGTSETHVLELSESTQTGARGESRWRSKYDTAGAYALIVRLRLPEGGEPVAETETVFAVYAHHPAEAPDAGELLAALDAGNPAFAGAREPIRRGDYPAAAAAILDGLRQRRLLSTALEAGPGGSGLPPAREERLALAELQSFYTAYPAGEPYRLGRPRSGGGAFDLDSTLGRLERAGRAVGGRMLHEPEMDTAFPVLLRGMLQDFRRSFYHLVNGEEGLPLQEDGARFLTALAPCDFLRGRKRWLPELAGVMLPAGQQLFFADGASRSGDVAGVSAAAFVSLVRLHEAAAGDPELMSIVGSRRALMRNPVRYLLAVRDPLGGWPALGPQGPHALSAAQATRLRERMPALGVLPGNRRAAPTASYPPYSDEETIGGLYCLRHGEGTDARWLAVDLGSYRRFPRAPAHRDFGTISLTAYGHRFLVDAGGRGGAAAAPEAHSTVLIDGLAASEEAYPVWGEPMPWAWHTNPWFDYVEGAIRFPVRPVESESASGTSPESAPEADSGTASGVRWRRALLGVRGMLGESVSDYWVVLDRVDAGRRAERRVEQKFQFAPGLRVREFSGSVLAETGTGPALRVIPAGESTATTISTGTGEGLPGMVYTAADRPVPAPAAILETTLRGGGALPVVLFPVPGTTVQPVRVRRLPDLLHRKTAVLGLDFGNGRVDYIAWGDLERETLSTAQEMQFRGEMALLRVREGRIELACLIHCQEFRAVDAGAVPWNLRLDEPATVMIERVDDRHYRVHGDIRNPRSIVFRELEIGRLRATSFFGAASIGPGEMLILK